MEPTYSIKNWNEFQHFKDRTPPWIKLYRDILDDPEWHQLDDKASKVLVMLWLIASEDKTHAGHLPCLKKLSFRLRMPENTVKTILSKLQHWVDISTISDGYRDDAPEKRREREETERETEKSVSQKNGKVEKPEGVPESVWEDFVVLRKSKKSAITETALNGIQREANKAGIALGEALTICCERGWQGFKAEWLHQSKNGHGYKTNFDRTLENAKKVMEGLHDD